MFICGFIVFMRKLTDIERDHAHRDSNDESAALPQGTKNYITLAGYTRLKSELQHLLDKERPALVKAALLAPGGPAAGDWGSHGLRLFTITA